MPRWDVHISFGLMAFIVFIAALLFGSRSSSSILESLRTVYFLWSLLLLGGGALIVGSILPDIDGKGKVKWIIGPIMGGMLLVPPLIGAYASSGTLGALGFLTGPGSMLFMAGTIFGYLLLLVPKKHRGHWQSNWTGMVYGGIWGVYVFYTASLALDQSLVIGSMGAVGYGWHLALDGKLF